MWNQSPHEMTRTSTHHGKLKAHTKYEFSGVDASTTEATVAKVLFFHSHDGGREPGVSGQGFLGFPRVSLGFPGFPWVSGRLQRLSQSRMAVKT